MNYRIESVCCFVDGVIKRSSKQANRLLVVPCKFVSFLFCSGVTLRVDGRIELLDILFVFLLFALLFSSSDFQEDNYCCGVFKNGELGDGCEFKRDNEFYSCYVDSYLEIVSK